MYEHPVHNNKQLTGRSRDSRNYLFLHSSTLKYVMDRIIQPDGKALPVGVRLQDHRRLFAPHQGLFRTIKKIEKLQPEVELFSVLHKIYLKLFRISVFNLNLRPFLVGVRLWCLRTVFGPI